MSHHEALVTIVQGFIPYCTVGSQAKITSELNLRSRAETRQGHQDVMPVSSQKITPKNSRGFYIGKVPPGL